MTETAQPNNTIDKIAILTKEAESLKVKLEEERQKLNDVACKYATMAIPPTHPANVFVYKLY